MSERLNLMVGDGVADLLTGLAGGERKRGEWLSRLVTAMHEQQQTAQANDLDQLRFAFIGLAGQVKLMDGRLQQVERNTAALMAGKEQPGWR